MNPGQILQRHNPVEANKQVSLDTSSGWSQTAGLPAKVNKGCKNVGQQISGGSALEHHQPDEASDDVLGEDHSEGRLWHRQQRIQGDPDIRLLKLKSSKDL